MLVMLGKLTGSSLDATKRMRHVNLHEVSEVCHRVFFSALVSLLLLPTTYPSALFAQFVCFLSAFGTEQIQVNGAMRKTKHDVAMDKYVPGHASAMGALCLDGSPAGID